MATQAKSEKATFFLRLVAFLIDIIILGIVDKVFFSLYWGFGPTAEIGRMMAYKNSFFPGVIMFAYFIIMDVLYGGTLGKKALKLRVVDMKTGANLTWMGAILREFVGRLVNSLTLGIGYLWVLWDKDKQGLHDKIGGSYVIKEG